MRNIFASTIAELASTDPRIVVLTGDIGNRLFDKFKAAFPGRFYNCGIAEQAMVSMAAGMAMSGLRPFVYTIAPFVTARCLEQIRVDLCYHHQPVVLAGVGGGLCYAELGGTHESCEDIAMLRVLPGMTVICPADAAELRGAMAAALAHDGPVYLRLGKKGEPNIHPQPVDFAIGRGFMLEDGRDAALIGTGIVMPTVIAAADILRAHGLSVRVVSLPAVKPLDGDLLDDCQRRCRLLVTVEEHSVLGGLGGAVAEWLTERPGAIGNLLRIGAADAFVRQTTDAAHAREHMGLTPAAIALQVQNRITHTDDAPLLLRSAS